MNLNQINFEVQSEYFNVFEDFSKNQRDKKLTISGRNGQVTLDCAADVLQSEFDFSAPFFVDHSAPASPKGLLSFKKEASCLTPTHRQRKACF